MIDLNARFTVHGESTDFVELQAEWTEQSDDGISVEIETRNFRYTIPDIDIYYHDKTVTIGNIPELRPDLNEAEKREVSPVWKSDRSGRVEGVGICHSARRCRMHLRRHQRAGRWRGRGREAGRPRCRLRAVAPAPACVQANRVRALRCRYCRIDSVNGCH